MKTLRDSLRCMVDQSARTGEPMRVRLPRGLTVAVVVENDVVSLQLSRADVYPSALEWKTVINHWPGQVVVVKEPKQVQQGKVFFLLGRLRLVPDLLMTAGDRDVDSLWMGGIHGG